MRKFSRSMKNKYLNKNQRHKPIKLKMKIRNRKTHLKANNYTMNIYTMNIIILVSFSWTL